VHISGTAAAAAAACVQQHARNGSVNRCGCHRTVVAARCPASGAASSRLKPTWMGNPCRRCCCLAHLQQLPQCRTHLCAHNVLLGQPLFRSSINPGDSVAHSLRQSLGIFGDGMPSGMGFLSRRSPFALLLLLLLPPGLPVNQSSLVAARTKCDILCRGRAQQGVPGQPLPVTAACRAGSSPSADGACDHHRLCC
jgi:hypothetical protein